MIKIENTLTPSEEMMQVQCSVCKSVFSANANKLEVVGFSSTNDIMYRFRCPVCGMERYAIYCKEESNDNHQ